MTILENAKKKMMDNSNNEIVQMRMNQRNNKFNRLKVQSSANLLKSVTNTLRRSSFTGTSVRNANQDTNSENGDSVVFVNSDKLDSSGAGNGNVKVDDGFNPFLYEPERNFKDQGEDFTSKTNEVKSKLLNRNKLERPKETEIPNKVNFKQQGDTTPKNKAQAQKVVHRKFFYYDQHGKIKLLGL